MQVGSKRHYCPYDYNMIGILNQPYLEVKFNIQVAKPQSFLYHQLFIPDYMTCVVVDGSCELCQFRIWSSDTFSIIIIIHTASVNS